MASKEDGSATNIPPYFEGSNYTYWKARINIFIRFMEIGTWIVVETDYTKPKDKLENDWDAPEKAAYLANYKALNTIICVVSQDECNRIFEL